MALCVCERLTECKMGQVIIWICLSHFSELFDSFVLIHRFVPRGIYLARCLLSEEARPRRVIKPSFRYIAGAT